MWRQQALCVDARLGPIAKVHAKFISAMLDSNDALVVAGVPVGSSTHTLRSNCTFGKVTKAITAMDHHRRALLVGGAGEVFGRPADSSEVERPLRDRLVSTPRSR